MPKQHVPGISCTGCCCVRFDLAVSWISKLGTQLGETTALSSPICFKFEAPFRVQLVGQIRHPNVVQYHDVGEQSDGTLFIAMEGSSNPEPRIPNPGPQTLNLNLSHLIANRCHSGSSRLGPTSDAGQGGANRSRRGCTLTAVTSVFKFSTHCALSHNARGRHWISLQVDATPCLMQHTSHIALEV
eukprot:2095906-Rhodomonas_salina.1